MKGKKGKEALAAAEEEFATRLKTLEASYQESLAVLSIKSLSISDADPPPDAEKVSASNNSGDIDDDDNDDEEAIARERKRAKAKKKKDRQKQKEAELEKRIEEENANAGPGLRKIELEQIQSVLSPQKLKVSEVEADGHCLYRAVAAQSGTDYMAIRSLCADTLSRHQEDFAPFCEYTDEISSFDQYLEKVRNSAEWGGHLELRALGIALNRPIYVYSLQSGAKPLAIHEDTEDETNSREPILLSYHLHYYALGEHYNQVVKE
eukprot:jgi/Psemu1/253238/estExt_Genewise1Plus.C_660025